MQIGAYLHDKGPDHVIKELLMSGNAVKPQLPGFHSSVNLSSRYAKSEMFSSFFFLTNHKCWEHF